ncbi:BA14K family protein [Bartonella tribocorum]|uniref:Lectin-like protein BA14k n=1 Tax=Bartonella tribocorum TaxID=85701 RepID=A0A2M6UXC6_9HYPH|nr:BA14K family protein [Bartonella tribocorum]PIT70861.1 BA14K family protein [Bartonella tribocorum]
MRESSKLAVLSAVSVATILAPISTALANSQWMHSGNYIEKQMNDMKSSVDRHIENLKKGINPHFPSYSSSSRSTVERHHSSHSHPHRHVDHKRREQHHHRVERKTYRYVEHKKTTHHHIHQHHVTPNNSGDALAAGILGLAAGAVLGNVFKKPEQPQIIYQPMPQRQVVYQEVPQVVYQQAPQTQIVYETQSTASYQPLQQPWTRGWFQYCQKRYRSFNPKTGTFRGYDGQDHFCHAPLN